MTKLNKKLMLLLASLSVGQIVEANVEGAIYKVSIDDFTKTVSKVAEAGYAIQVEAVADGEIIVKIKEATNLNEFINDGEYFGGANVESQLLAGRCPPKQGGGMS